MAQTRTRSKKTTTTRTRSKASSARTLDFNWEEFSPEWATEGLERITTELEKWNDDVQARSEKFRKESRERIEEYIEQVQAELRKLPGVKRAEELRQETLERVEKNIDAGVDRVYTSLKLARLDEVKNLERKIATLNKKLRMLERKQAA